MLPAFGPIPAVPPQWQHSVELARALREALIVLGQLAAAREETRRVVVEHDAHIRSAVARLRVAGASWGQIGAALGISRQGARQRFDVTAHAARRSREDRAGANAPRDDVARDRA